jgi:excisionase family DNA binding protein
MQQPRNCSACGVQTLLPRYCRECEYITQKQAAKELRVSRATFFRMVAAGRIHPRKIGVQKTLVARQEIDNLLSGHSFPR